ncbi:hypothetical protein N9D66_00370 [Candidatus Nanopelagicales bacterium]|nr:hypothetical protein [Candidatus Nanopelagicales bacterium]
MYARVSRNIGTNGHAYAIDEIFPKVRALPGVKGVIMLGNPDRNETISVVLYEDEAALLRNTQAARQLREQTFDNTGHELVDVVSYEVIHVDMDLVE